MPQLLKLALNSPGTRRKAPDSEQGPYGSWNCYCIIPLAQSVVKANIDDYDMLPAKFSDYLFPCPNPLETR